MKKVFDFIVYSSANPDKYSQTLKGILLGIIPFILYTSGIACSFGDYCWGMSPNDLELLAEDIVQFFTVVLSVISAVMTAYGAGRKVFRTITGQNKVLQR